jgi:hypothetical protein
MASPASWCLCLRSCTRRRPRARQRQPCRPPSARAVEFARAVTFRRREDSLRPRLAGLAQRDRPPTWGRRPPADHRRAQRTRLLWRKSPHMTEFRHFRLGRVLPARCRGVPGAPACGQVPVPVPGTGHHRPRRRRQSAHGSGGTCWPGYAAGLVARSESRPVHVGTVHVATIRVDTVRVDTVRVDTVRVDTAAHNRTDSCGWSLACLRWLPGCTSTSGARKAPCVRLDRRLGCQPAARQAALAWRAIPIFKVDWHDKAIHIGTGTSGKGREA